jgi:hypothetical protein
MTIFLLAVIAGIAGVLLENFFYDRSQSHRRF